MTIYFVTGNEMKAREAAHVVPGLNRIELDLPEIQSLDPKEVIEAKLAEAHRQMPGKTLAVEDVTYSIDGLNGLPGTLIKWFVRSMGPIGIHDLVKTRDCKTTVAAHLGIVQPDGSMTFVSGEVDGMTVAPDTSTDGVYHFDNIFMPNGHEKRYSEMTLDEKTAISHRTKAWQAMKQLLENDS